MDKHPVEVIADAVGGKIESMGALPDGSGFATVSFPLPKTHWLYADDGTFDPPPMSLRMGTDDPGRQILADKIRAAARYAIRAATMRGKEMDFDPDALVQNMVVGLIGYWTPDGLSSDQWANPPLVPSPSPPTGSGEGAIQQAARLLRLWAGERQRASGKWTTQEQAAVECAIQLEVISPVSAGAGGEALRDRLKQLVTKWREKSDADRASMEPFMYGGEQDGDKLDADIEATFTVAYIRSKCAAELEAALSLPVEGATKREWREEEIGYIFDQAQSCERQPRAALWCYWPNSTEPPCEHCKWTMDMLIQMKEGPAREDRT